MRTAWEPDRRGPPPAMEPPRAGLEPPRHDLRDPAGPPLGGAIALTLPPAARGVLANNDSVKTEGLQGLVTVEYRMLVPSRRAGAIFASRGGLGGVSLLVLWAVCCQAVGTTVGASYSRTWKLFGTRYLLSTGYNLC